MVGQSASCARRAVGSLDAIPAANSAVRRAALVSRGAIWVVDQVEEVGVKPVQHGGPLLFNQPQRQTRFKQGHQYHPSPRYQRHDWPLVKPEAVEQGQVHQDYVPGSHALTVGRIHQGALNVVVVHHPFGKTGSARGVHQQNGNVRVHRPLPLL